MNATMAVRKWGCEMVYPFHFFKSPGSKCWFLPFAVQFAREVRPKTIVEPFAGSAVVGLTLLNRGYGQRLVMAEKDPLRQLVWKAALGDASFSERMFRWKLEAWAQPVEKQAKFVWESLTQMEKSDPPLFELLRTMAAFNGIVAGQNSISNVRPIRRWLPDTIDSSLQFVYEARHQIELLADAFDALEQTNSPDSYGFVDPPYTAGEKSPGHKLYRQSQLNHRVLLEVLASWRGSSQLTAEYCPAMRSLLRHTIAGIERIQKYVVPMQTGSGRRKVELIVSREALDEPNASGRNVRDTA